ncbi:CPBP family intramembrane metalloprotease [Clostridiaceae bacterium M8S5]|nr:CPBP family intramembrane metalloprotease [Clostridiaceae bacterium M8S5]
MKNYKNGFSNKIGLFGLAEKTKVNRNLIWFGVLSFMIITAGGMPANIIGEALFPEKTQPYWNLFINLSFGFGFISLLIFAIVKYREKRTIRDLGFQKEGAFKHYIIGFIIGLIMLGLTTLIIVLLGGLKFVPKAQNVGTQMLPTIMFILIGWIIQGGTEEVIYRGWMLPLLGEKYNVPIALIFSSIIFAAVHLGNNSISIMPVINLVSFGLFASLYVVYKKSLWGICGLHGAWNWMQGNIVGVQVSGNVAPGGSLIKLQAQGNHIISGGSFGIEGSVVCSIVLILSSLYLVIRIINMREYEV